MTNLVGKTIAGCQINELVAESAQAQVYKGYQPSENRYVAVKVLKPEAAQNQAAVQSFNQYAQLAKNIQHPNILPVLESGEENGVVYLVSPFMENRSVADHRASYREPNQLLGLLQGIVPGLQAIYNQGYVHGNLRSTNILLDAQGRPQLADFAIAFQPGEAPTPYNSPEQVGGGVVDQRTDVYALGIILYELLAGVLPPPGTVVNLQAARPDVPAVVAQVIQKATAQNPDQRFQNPGELQNALANALQPVAQPAPAQATATTTVEVQAPPQKGTNWMGIALGALAVIALCLCVVFVGPRVIESINPPAGGSESDASQPVEPPADAPLEQPPEQPPEQQPPPEADQPPEQPPAEGSGSSVFPACAGSIGFAGGFVLLTGGFTIKRRSRRRVVH
jgi:serine/threonine protein kinase